MPTKEIDTELLQEIRGLLEECEEFIDDYSDVVSGGWGHEYPNKAMDLAITLRATLKQLP